MEKLKIGEWTFGLGKERKLTENQIYSLEEFVEKWGRIETEIRKGDPTTIAAVREFGVPTILCRVDMAPFNAGEEIDKKVYEVEARPAGLGVMTKISPGFVENLKAMWKPLKSVGTIVLPSRDTAKDDTLIFSKAMGWQWIKISSLGPLSPYLWVRGGKTDKKMIDSLNLEERALAPVTAHGDKTYLLKMGLATLVKDIHQLSMMESFVVKPLYGSKARKILIYYPLMPGYPGVYRWNTIRKILEEKKEERFIVQPFILPAREKMKIRINKAKRPGGFVIWRLFFAYDFNDEQWRFVGGAWNWRPSLLVHGAPDAVFGSLRVD